VTVYVDDLRVPARVGRISARWSHLTADTREELHQFAARLGMRREWFQGNCKLCRAECVHWHYDVTDTVRNRAIGLGATTITFREMGALIRARRAVERAQHPGESAT
jgi:hypothetical protein